MKAQRSLGERLTEAKSFPEMLSVVTDPALEVFQVTTGLSCAANSRGGPFSLDSKHFFFRRQRPSGDQWTLCDIEGGPALRALTDEPGGAAVTPDSRHFYHLASAGPGDAAHVWLERIDLTDFRRETVAVFDAPVPGIGLRMWFPVWTGRKKLSHHRL